MIICCIAGGAGASSVCDNDGYTGNRETTMLYWAMRLTGSLSNGDDSGNVVNTASATEVIGTCGGAGANCARALQCPLVLTFDVAAAR